MTSADILTVRALAPGDEESFITLRAAITDEGAVFAKDYQPGISWPEYLAIQDNVRVGIGLPPGAVPYTFLVADLGCVLVGSSDIRHHLTEKLTRWGGHIGYVVLPGTAGSGTGQKYSAKH